MATSNVLIALKELLLKAMTVTRGPRKGGGTA
jgi:hypothetical protein